MNRARVGALARMDLLGYARRPLVWVWAALLIVVAWLFGQGDLSIQSGDTSVGGTKALITSQFALAQFMALGTLLFHGFFVAIVSGMPVIRDHDVGMDELLHSTPLRRREYVWGKYGAALATCLALLGVQLAGAVFFNHAVPTSNVEVRGRLALANYLLPALVFAVPLIVFISGVSFGLGAWTRKPLTVFVLPVALLLLSAFLFWEWAPAGMSQRVNTLLMLLDPAGFRWLQQTFLEVDRGVTFYNTQPVGWEGAFLFSRLVLTGVGLAVVALTARERSARPLARSERRPDRAARARAAAAAAVPARGSLAPLQMRRVPRSWVVGLWQQVRIELSALTRQSGIYLFVPVILLTTLPGALNGTGPFDSDVVPTAGTLAARCLSGLFMSMAFLLLFYVVESFERDARTRMAPIIDSAPVPTSAWLLGRILANALLGLGILAVAFVGSQAILALESSPLRSPWPFLLLWGILGLPTILVWCAFVAMVWTVFRNRFACYAAGLITLAGTGLLIVKDKVNWLTNWALYKTVIWSDISVLEHDRRILVLNRLFMVSLAVLFARAALALHRRREPDALARVPLSQRSLSRALAANAPFWVPSLALGLAIWIPMSAGYQGPRAEREDKDYWRQNLATYRDAKLPDLSFVDLRVEIEPDAGTMKVDGTYELENRTGAPLRHIPITLDRHLRAPVFSLDGKDYKPESRSGLYVFTPPAALAPGQRLRLGFSYRGRLPDGPSERGGRIGKFILPSSVMLGSLGGSFVPSLGMVEDRGIDEDNRFEERVYDADFFLGETPTSLAGIGSAFRTRIRVITPPDVSANSVGVKTLDVIEKGRRVVVWESDQPVYIFNVIAGRWQTARGEGVEVFYDARHALNVPEMVAGLQAARKYYSKWFFPFPWQTLKLSEFAGLDAYAEGYPTNISFSENIGFLAKPGSEDNLVFWITAHEAAHQWWPNLVVPGRGPGAEVLSEGMSHFSAMLLLEAVKGESARMEFARRIEHHYEKGRNAAAEQPLTGVDSGGKRKGLDVVWYDRGGWAFWMLAQTMGRPQLFAGLHEFVQRYRSNRDHPVLQDLFEVLRLYAPDPVAFDDTIRQWFDSVTLPRFELLSAAREPAGTGWRVSGTVRNAGTGRLWVELAAATGERFTRTYKDARTKLLLTPNAATPFSIASPFEPDRVEVDPDVMVLQQGRKGARRTF